MKNLQQAADDAGVIAETIESLHTLLDRFHATHGEKIYARLEEAWPDAPRIHGPSNVYKLSRDLAPRTIDNTASRTEQMQQIIERLKAAHFPDRELDADIWLAVTPGATRKKSTVKSSTGAWPDYEIDETRDASHRLILVPAYTASFDAAVALVPEGWSYRVSENEKRNWGQVTLGRSYPTNANVAQEAVTPILALCIAALKARNC
jgi:hypothetical protein